MPFYLGMAATARPAGRSGAGAEMGSRRPRWCTWLALAMPMMTLQVLYAPASDACGRPGISAQNAATGALCLPIAFLIGVHWGLMGLVAAWFAAYPVYLAVSTWRTLPVIGVKLGALLRGDPLRRYAPPARMALLVTGLDRLLPPLPALPHLALLVSAGGLIYGRLLFLFARPVLIEVDQT